MNNIYSYKFWLSIRPGELSPHIFNLFLYTVIASIVLAFVLVLLTKTTKKAYYNQLLKNLYILFLTNAIFGGLLLFFTFELIPFLSSRFWFLLWALGNIVWVIFIIKGTFKVSRKKQEMEKEKEFKKYIPPKK